MEGICVSTGAAAVVYLSVRSAACWLAAWGFRAPISVNLLRYGGPG